MTDKKNRKVNVYLSGQAVGTLLGCGMLWAILSLCGVGAKADKDAHGAPKKEVVRPVLPAVDGVKAIQLDSLARSRQK